jgi:RNA recognition motif-containing protein
MSSNADKVTDSVNDVTASLGNISISDKHAGSAVAGEMSTNAAHNEAVLASAAEGRRLYIGNLAYATTEGELTNFFKGYLV